MLEIENRFYHLYLFLHSWKLQIYYYYLVYIFYNLEELVGLSGSYSFRGTPSQPDTNRWVDRCV